MDNLTDRLDVSGHLMTLLAATAEAAIASRSSDAMALIASNTDVRNAFIDLCQELRENGSEMALVEFGPVKDRGMVLVLDDPTKPVQHARCHILVSADTHTNYAGK